MELKSSDLRIGNFVFDKNVDILIVSSITKNSIHSLQKYEFIGCPIEWINPIPLSVEWLKKAGYKQLRRVEKTYSLGNFEDNSSIYFTGVRFIHIQTGTHLEFVHEWQNIYSAIFKKELKVSL